MSAPLGVRIHNPGNIRWSHWSSAQPGAVQAVEGFVEFTSVYDGQDAQMRLLGLYNTDHGCESISQVVNLWAPATVAGVTTGNDPYQYAMSVAQIMNLGNLLYGPLPWPATIPVLAHAMACVEIGGHYAPTLTSYDCQWRDLAREGASDA